MIYRRIPPLLRLMPTALRRYVLHFEWTIETAARDFASSLKPGSWVLDAGAGEGQYASLFARQRYVGVDLAVGDAEWKYGDLDAIADLSSLPFREATFEACVNIVTLEHVPEPARVIAEIFRALQPGGLLFLVTPHEWEEHQQPHDYFRYTSFGVRYLLSRAGFEQVEIRPVGGYFRLLSRRLLNGLQFMPKVLAPLYAVLVAPAALVAPLLEPLDRQQTFTLGHICTARKPLS